ncbi:hypothetical protein [Candidatus Neptunichlamydia sp. REUL1]|uniref:hypothetical protein n=1 Tax=Candidatus Neptunichlamydia sp. REUL1 TaxID=3064277 RepID=UPI00292E2126|nr:hypothetical protein [Candidatus Neptunochlamydia sp. REUL1]
MTTSALQFFQNNRCHTQDLVSVLCASVLIKFGCKRIQPISTLVAFVSGVEGASFLVIAKSVHTLRTFFDAGERRSAKRALMFAFSAAFGAAALKKHYATAQMPCTIDKPLIITTCAIMALAETEMRAPKWIPQIFGGLLDTYFPEPNVFLQPLGPPRPIARLPEEMQPMKWDPEAIIASFREGAEEEVLLHNMEVLLRATECQLARSSEFPTKFYQVLRRLKDIAPDFSDWIKLAYCTIQKEEVEEGFYERNDISVKGIYDAIIWSMMHDTLNALPEENKEQLQLLVDLIPVHIKDNREVNRTRTKVWFVVSKIQGLDLMLGLKLRTLDDKIKGTSGTMYLKSSECDLGLLRKAAKELLAI